MSKSRLCDEEGTGRVNSRPNINSVYFELARPAGPAQIALRLEKKLSFRPFATKAGLFRRSTGGWETAEAVSSDCIIKLGSLLLSLIHTGRPI